jgi:hypothetical protein
LKGWSTAAADATEDLCITINGSNRCAAGLQDWLRKHGSSGMCSIALTINNEGTGEFNVNISFQQLQDLQSLSLINSRRYESFKVLLQCSAFEQLNFSAATEYGALQGGETSSPLHNTRSTSTVLKAPTTALESLGKTQPGLMPPLTTLKLHYITLQGGEAGWRSLSALTTLQHLDLKQTPDLLQQRSAVELGEVLPQLTRLTYLSLEWQVTEQIKPAPAALTQLKDLRLQRPRHLSVAQHHQHTAASPTSRLNLPHGLTRLEVHLAQQFCTTDSSTPDLAYLTNLQHLELHDATWLNTSLMSDMAQLTHLQLCMGRNAFNAACMTDLLYVLGNNAQLRHLQLEFGTEESTQSSVIKVPAELLEQCSALTTSSHLTTLQLSGVQLPNACGKRLFPAGRILPHLTTLKLFGKAKRWWDNGWNSLPPSASDAPIGPAGELYSLVECCPNLQNLDLAGAVQSGVDMSALRHLLRLTAVVVGGQGMDDNCAAGLGQVRQLRKLIVIDPAKNNFRAENSDYYDFGSTWDHSHGDGAASKDGGSYFTCKGLSSLMQLTGLSAFKISRETCLYHGLRWSDAHDYDTDEEFEGWQDERLQALLGSNKHWQEHKVKERMERLAGELGSTCCSCTASLLLLQVTCAQCAGPAMPSGRSA